MRWNYIIWIAAGCAAFPVVLRAASVSYALDIAPIFAFHCNGCHGDNGLASGLDTRSWKSLRQGGELGADVVPGDSQASAIVLYIEGRRGEQHRMPLGSHPLSGSQIALMRAWIDAGALDDGAEIPVYRLGALHIAWSGLSGLRVSFMAPVKSYLMLRLLASSGSGLLFARGASVKEPSERMDAGAPGEWIRWTVRRENEWPGRINVELEIRYASQPPRGARLLVEDLQGRRLAYQKL